MNTFYRKFSIVTAGLLGAVLLQTGMPAGYAGEPGQAGDVAVLEKTGKAFSEVAKKVMPAVVYIEVQKSVPLGGRYHQGDDFNDPHGYFGDDFLRRFFGYGDPGRSLPRQFQQEGQGSGFIISEDGYILTNNHVVGDMDEILVRLSDGREFKARLVGTDPHSEVAVIKIDGHNLPVLPLGDSNDLDIGEWVIAVGNPFGLSGTLTVGVVSAKGRNMGIADYENFIQTDAAINPGNSGGPLVNVKGEAVGINTAIFSRSGGYMGIGFAIPMNMARDIKDQLVKTGRVQRGFIGISIQDLDANLARSFGLSEPKGILIAGVQEDSAGEQAGLQREDIILKLNNRDVDKSSAFRSNIASLKPGTSVELVILRGDEEKTIRFPIGILGDDGETAQAGEPDSPATADNQIGLAVENLTPEIGRQLGYSDRAGVIISQVEEGSPAERAGLQPGQLITSVNRKPVASVKEFEEALRSSPDQKMVLLLVEGENFSRFVALSTD